jgi:hypothetical protein
MSLQKTDRTGISISEGTEVKASKAGTFKATDRQQARCHSVLKVNRYEVGEPQVRLRRYYSREADFYRSSRRSSYRSRQCILLRFNNG